MVMLIWIEGNRQTHPSLSIHLSISINMTPHFMGCIWTPLIALCRLNCCSIVLAEIMSKLMPFCLMIFLYNLWGFTGIGPIDLLFHLNGMSPFVFVKHIGCGDGQSQIPLSVLVCVCTLHLCTPEEQGRDWACPINHCTFSA